MQVIRHWTLLIITTFSLLVQTGRLPDFMNSGLSEKHQPLPDSGEVQLSESAQESEDKSSFGFSGDLLPAEFRLVPAQSLHWAQTPYHFLPQRSFSERLYLRNRVLTI